MRVADLFHELFVSGPVGEFLLLPTTRSNGHPAVADYLKRPGDDEFRAAALDVLRLVDGRVDEIVVFDKRFFPLFGLPQVWVGNSGPSELGIRTRRTMSLAGR